jgi:phage gpG-like protein
MAKKVTVEQLIHDIKKLVKILPEDLSKPNKQAGAVMLRSIRTNFRAGGRPTKWIRSDRVIEKGGTTLIDTRTLINSINARTDKKSVRVGTNVFYALYLHFGTRMKGSRSGRINIPARPFVMFQQQDFPVLLKIYSNYLMNGIK